MLLHLTVFKIDTRSYTHISIFVSQRQKYNNRDCLKFNIKFLGKIHGITDELYPFGEILIVRSKYMNRCCKIYVTIVNANFTNLYNNIGFPG